VSEREMQGAYRMGMRIAGAKSGKRGEEGESRRVKSRSPCAACGSETRSSFLHLQVEYRGIRDSPHRCFSIPIFSSFFVFRFAIVFAFVGNRLSKRTLEIVLRGAKGALSVPRGSKRTLLFEEILFGNLLI